jgi:hypothetical protein
MKYAFIMAIVTVIFTDLDQGIEMVIFESILITFEARQMGK